MHKAASTWPLAPVGCRQLATTQGHIIKATHLTSILGREQHTSTLTRQRVQELPHQRRALQELTTKFDRAACCKNCWKKLMQGAGVLTISIMSPEYPGLV
jgi:hypothetical protein